MKIHILYAIVFLMLGTTCVLSQNSDEIQGPWEIVYSEYVYTAFYDTVIEAEFKYPSVKLLTKNHFAFGRRTTNGESISAGGGKYSYNGETYTEHIKYHTHSSAIGTSVEFKSQLEGDKWTIKGVIPDVDGDIKLMQIWKRID